MPVSPIAPSAGSSADLTIRTLHHQPGLARNTWNALFTGLAALFALIVVLPLVLVLAYVLIKGGSMMSLQLLSQLPPSPGQTGGGIGNAILGTLIVSLIAALIAIPVGVGGGIYLAEYSKSGPFASFVRFGTNVLSGVPSIICGVFIYGLIVATRLFYDQSYSAMAGGIALSVLMLPTIIKTTDEGLKLVPQELRWGAIGVGASKFVTITRITLPTAFKPIATGIVLSIARAAGETAPLIFTALFSPFWPEGLFSPIASMSVLIYNFATSPDDVQIALAWASSFVLVMMILMMNILARYVGSLNKA